MNQSFETYVTVEYNDRNEKLSCIKSIHLAFEA